MESEMADLWNLIRREIHRTIRAEISRPSKGVVTGWDPDRHMAKVKLQPYDNETGWLPVNAHHIGNGYGVMVGLNIGDQVEVGYQEGDPNTPCILGRYHSDVDKPPRVESGEVLLKHQSGSTIFMDKNGNVHIKSNGSLYVNGSEATV